MPGALGDTPGDLRLTGGLRGLAAMEASCERAD